MADVHVAEGFLRLPRAVIQVEETHFLQVLVHQEDVVWVQVGVDNVFLVEDIEKVNDLYGDFDCFKFTENGQFLRLRMSVFALFF